MYVSRNLGVLSYFTSTDHHLNGGEGE